MVCKECHEAIHAAYAFRSRVKTVEEQINKKKRGAVIIDLKTVLEVVAQEKLKKANVNKDDSRFV